MMLRKTVILVSDFPTVLFMTFSQQLNPKWTLGFVIVRIKPRSAV